jgi:hypothetical protein
MQFLLGRNPGAKETASRGGRDNNAGSTRALQKGKVFSLWMKYELAKHEEELINKYNIRRTILVEGNPRQEKERAGKMAAVLAVLVGVGAMPFLRVPGPAIALGIITLIVGWIAIYNYIRETVRVNDILNGRHFACRSIFTLLNKEEELGLLAEKICCLS